MDESLGGKKMDVTSAKQPTRTEKIVKWLQSLNEALELLIINGRDQAAMLNGWSAGFLGVELREIVDKTTEDTPSPECYLDSIENELVGIEHRINRLRDNIGHMNALISDITNA